MEQPHTFTAVVQREGEAYVAYCPELDFASEGPTIELARANLVEVITLFLEEANPDELAQRLNREVLVTQIEIPAS